MVEWLQAIGTFNDTRRFYKLGVKSENKGYYITGKYNSEAPLQLESDVTLSTKQKARNNFLADYSRFRTPKLGDTPYALGCIKYLSNSTDGNCGVMAAVALYLAITKFNVKRTEAVLKTVLNPNYTARTYTLTFGHTWLELGTGRPQYCVDPWAGVCCPVKDFKDEFLEKMQIWQTKGKRIAVNWKNLLDVDRRYWAHPTDPAIAALLAADAITYYKMADQEL